MVTDIFYTASNTDRLPDAQHAYLIQCDISVNVTHLFYSFFWSGAPLMKKEKPRNTIIVFRGE